MMHVRVLCLAHPTSPHDSGVKLSDLPDLSDVSDMSGQPQASMRGGKKRGWMTFRVIQPLLVLSVLRRGRKAPMRDY